MYYTGTSLNRPIENLMSLYPSILYSSPFYSPSHVSVILTMS
uniref:Uncharacterized protein n=1 Tax=Anguilla anguilla TaxID=7936 RepID=A0A0E9RU33_ANGAN